MTNFSLLGTSWAAVQFNAMWSYQLIAKHWQNPWLWDWTVLVNGLEWGFMANWLLLSWVVQTRCLSQVVWAWHWGSGALALLWCVLREYLSEMLHCLFLCFLLCFEKKPFEICLWTFKFLKLGRVEVSLAVSQILQRWQLCQQQIRLDEVIKEWSDARINIHINIAFMFICAGFVLRPAQAPQLKKSSCVV